MDPTDFLRNLHSFELACITVLVGVLTTTLILRLCAVNPGGILGTAFFLLAAGDSVYWALTLLAIAPFISWLYNRFCSHIYQGREPIFIMAGMSVILSTVLGLSMQYLHIIPPSFYSFPLGIILPAIVASAIRKQGVAQTYRYLSLAIVLALEALIIITAAGQWLGLDFMELERLAEPRQELQLSWAPLFAVASVLIGYLTYRRYQVKAAGFVVLPLMATIAIVSPLNLLLLLATAAVVYGLTALLRRYSLVIGISRYALAAAISITLVYTVTYLLLHYTSNFSPYMGTGLFAALAVTVIVNEHTIYGIMQAFPIFAVSLAAMAGIEIGGAYLVSLNSHTSHGLHYYVIRQATER